MNKFLTLILLLVTLPAIAAEKVALPEDEWQPLTLQQAESVCVYEKPQRPYMDHKMHDTTDKKTKQCIEKTTKYGLVGKNFIGITGHYREEKAVRERQLELERQTAKQQTTPAASEETMPRPTTAPTSSSASEPATTTRGGTKSDSQRLLDLEKRLEQLEKENALLKKQVEDIKK